ncbi:uncharacterized protein EV420DRAFT_496746 [Desarmillaria tabescens]|uniref:F-box domain-containing protein n=1 Tax=Armillaria tabescens TaxID=1929756 RepID=A0AA39N4T4_ARMTA|nr:uncharacterized protein EV420DRAFT_496746 [Desarmillaria tabescens]KAK0457473.1 hypothetical protein EV420DRAFT_496746 [Desarmillaria tabescens]
MHNLPEILDRLVQKYTPNLDYEFPQSFSSFLKTNDLPTGSDAKVLGDLSKNVSDALRLITSDMESLIDTHAQLKKIKDHLLRVDDDIKTAMPPIECLPAEMLIQIFKEASENGDAFDMGWEPFVISRVCHKWRVVATEKCPEIWTEFRLERDRWDDLKGPVSLLSLVLSRGTERSLEFTFDASGGNDVSDCESEKDVLWDEEDEDTPRPYHYRRDDGVTEQLLQNLVRYCHRWSNVYVSIPARLFHLLSPIRGKLQSLVAFSLVYVTDVLALPLSVLTESHILDGAPLLETVSVSCYQSHVPVLVPQGVPNLTSYSDKRQRVGDETLH